MPVLAGPPSAAQPEFPSDLPTRAYLGDSGIVLNGSSQQVLDGAGCLWKLASPLWGTAAPREATGDREAAHGAYDGTDFYGAREISLQGTVHAPDHAALHDAERRLRDVVSLRRFTYRATEPGFDGYAEDARQSGEVLFAENSHTHATYSAKLFVPDALIWSSLERTLGPLRLPTSTGGLVFPRTRPLVFETTVDGGTATLVNPGSEPVGLLLRINGGVGDLTLTLTDPTGRLGEAGVQTMRLDNPEGRLLRTGEWLLVDTALHRLQLMGTASRRGWFVGDWLTLPPGAVGDDACTLAVSGFDASSRFSVTGSWRAARI